MENIRQNSGGSVGVMDASAQLSYTHISQSHQHWLAYCAPIIRSNILPTVFLSYYSIAFRALMPTTENHSPDPTVSWSTS